MNNLKFLKKYFQLPVSLLLLSLYSFSAGENIADEKGTISAVTLIAKNPLDRERADVLLTVSVNYLKSRYPGFDEKAFAAFENNVEIPSQSDDPDGDGKSDNILLLTSFKAGEVKTISLIYGKTERARKNFEKRTQAVLATKFNYLLKDGCYTGGEFRNISELEVPRDHFAHNALIKFEGPGWESDKVAYRFYLDSRNRNDIFAKKVDDLVLHFVGNNDLASDSKESYTKMNVWGMDIFKVGESLGIGSIGMWYDNKINAVTKTDKVTCKITGNGIIKSDVLTKYEGWSVGEKKYNMNSLISISAGSRLTKEEISIVPVPENICTGLAKHAGCPLIRDENNFEWSYIASYGKQSLAGDNLGIAVFFKRSELTDIFEDGASFIVKLKPDNGKVTYYFAAAPEMELNGIKSEDEFKKYLDNVIGDLGSPVSVELK